MTGLPTCFIINLDRSPERWARISSELDALGLPYQRVRALDGKGTSLDAWAANSLGQIDLVGWRRLHHRDPKPTEVACYLSHLTALQAFEKSGDEFGLILEDDAEPRPDLADVLAQLVQEADAWDIVKLHARHPGPQIRWRALGDERHLTSFVLMHAGATAYLVKRSVTPTFRSYLEHVVLPFDHRIDRSFSYGLRMRGVDPMPIGLTAHASTIEYADQAKKKGLRRYGDPPYLSRWRVPLYRSWGAVRRLWHNLIIDGGLVQLVRGSSV